MEAKQKPDVNGFLEKDSGRYLLDVGGDEGWKQKTVFTR